MPTMYAKVTDSGLCKPISFTWPQTSVLSASLVLGAGSWTGFPAAGDTVHRVDIIDPIEQSTPALGADGTVYVGDADGFVTAYHPPTKGRRSRYLSGSIVSAPVLGNDGTIYVGTTATATDNFFALAPATLEEKRHFKADGAIKSSPAIGRDWTVYVGTTKGYLYALDPETLAEKWSVQLRRYDDGSGVALDITGGPVTGPDGTLYVPTAHGDASQLLAIEPHSGKIKWRYANFDGIQVAPAIGSNGDVLFVDADSFLVCLNSQGERRWWHFLDGGLTSPVVGRSGEIYVGSTKNFVACYSKDGDRRWEFSTEGERVRGAPVVGARSRLYVASGNKTLRCIRTSDKAELWQTRLDKGTRAIGNIVLAPDGLLWFGGGLYLFGVQSEDSPAWTAYWPCFRGDLLNTGLSGRVDGRAEFLQPFAFSNGRVGLALKGEPDGAYQFEKSDDFRQWSVVGTFRSQSGLYSTVEGSSPLPRAKFYRARNATAN